MSSIWWSSTADIGTGAGHTRSASATGFADVCVLKKMESGDTAPQADHGPTIALTVNWLTRMIHTFQGLNEVLTVALIGFHTCFMLETMFQWHFYSHRPAHERYDSLPFFMQVFSYIRCSASMH